MVFEHKQISNHVYRIKEPTGVYVYLVVGKDKACLLDTGYGYGDIKTYVASITKKEPFVVLTHGHIDHIGGTKAFSEVYMNVKDHGVYEKHAQEDFRVGFYEENKAGLPGVAISDLSTPISLDKIKPLHEQDCFDLGDVHVQAIEIPGHTPGMMTMLIPEDRIMVFGDACGVSVLLFDEFSSCVSDYRESLYKLKTYESKYDHVVRNHGTGESPKVLLDHVIECCDAILQDKDDRIPITIAHEHLYLANAVNDKMERLDGKEGNILYRIDKKR